ncbi:hypothetical protein ZIOFF_006310 [Zingiber officinale]|uniref:Uncharacterized protein n=1 Tax=Zingiber officinale TaxID=94328 RepID=A0A8J5HXX1_ZINOF|nr:hypothetical protein ZIOFF_006310 [Zingiber officinale]
MELLGPVVISENVEGKKVSDGEDGEMLRKEVSHSGFIHSKEGNGLSAVDFICQPSNAARQRSLADHQNQHDDNDEESGEGSPHCECCFFTVADLDAHRPPSPCRSHCSSRVDAPSPVCTTTTLVHVQPPTTVILSVATSSHSTVDASFVDTPTSCRVFRLNTGAIIREGIAVLPSVKWSYVLLHHHGLSSHCQPQPSTYLHLTPDRQCTNCRCHYSVAPPHHNRRLTTGEQSPLSFGLSTQATNTSNKRSRNYCFPHYEHPLAFLLSMYAIYACHIHCPVATPSAAQSTPLSLPLASIVVDGLASNYQLMSVHLSSEECLVIVGKAPFFPPTQGTYLCRHL